MIKVLPVTLELHGVRLEPLDLAHVDGLRSAASDGELWNLWVTSVPKPENTEKYILTALEMRDALSSPAASRNRLPWAVIDAHSGAVIGTTSLHDIVPEVDRVEIGFTWYAKSRQRTHVNTACKLMLLSHAFDALGCAVVGLRTDNFNHVSQAAIERLGAKKDGVLRHHYPRPDGSVRDTVMYSILRDEWPPIKARLQERLARG